MADCLKQHPPHPFDPLSSTEIEYAIAIVRRDHGQLGYNAVTLSEPKKKDMLAWLADSSLPRPRRLAEVVAVDKASAVYDGVVDLGNGKIISWEKLSGVQPLVYSPNPITELVTLITRTAFVRSLWRTFRILR